MRVFFYSKTSLLLQQIKNILLPKSLTFNTTHIVQLMLNNIEVKTKMSTILDVTVFQINAFVLLV